MLEKPYFTCLYNILNVHILKKIKNHGIVIFRGALIHEVGLDLDECSSHESPGGGVNERLSIGDSKQKEVKK